MPTFEDMQKMYSSTNNVGEQIKEMSNMIMNETFSNSTGYRKGMIYDCYGSPIEELEFKFLKTQTYTIAKDQVEYYVQFRPGVNPEIDYDKTEDQAHRLGYYIDIKDENSKLIEKWLILGKNNAEFDKYLVLKCNRVLEWIDEDRVYHKALGVLRDLKNYGSGVWSDGTSTTVNNITSFFLPANDITRTIYYGVRFMITDNPKHPLTYETTKILDSFPLGIFKFTVSQSHFNPHTDICEKIKIEGVDEEPVMHMLCDYKKSSLPPLIVDEDYEEATWKLLDTPDKLYVKGQPIDIQAVSDKENSSKCEWHIYIDGEEYTNKLDELNGYFEINIDEKNNIFTINAINKIMVKYIVKISIQDKNKTYYDYVEMEVCE